MVLKAKDISLADDILAVYGAILFILMKSNCVLNSDHLLELGRALPQQ